MTKYFFSPESHGFYNSDVHGTLPEDVIEISEEHFRSLMVAQSQGLTIVYEDSVLSAVEIVRISEWTQIRKIRDALLSESDWVLMTDSPVTKEMKQQWLIYRKELRDLPKTFDKTSDIVWPVAPSSTKA